VSKISFLKLEKKIHELAEAFGLKPEDLNLELGPLGKLLDEGFSLRPDPAEHPRGYNLVPLLAPALLGNQTLRFGNPNTLPGTKQDTGFRGRHDLTARWGIG
jgi:hypothetical protein